MWLLLRLCLPFCVTCLVSHTHTHTHTHTHKTCCVGLNFRTVWHTSCQTHTHTHTHTKTHTHTLVLQAPRSALCDMPLVTHTRTYTHTPHILAHTCCGDSAFRALWHASCYTRTHTHTHTLVAEPLPSALCDMPHIALSGWVLATIGRFNARVRVATQTELRSPACNWQKNHSWTNAICDPKNTFYTYDWTHSTHAQGPYSWSVKGRRQQCSGVWLVSGCFCVEEIQPTYMTEHILRILIGEGAATTMHWGMAGELVVFA